MARAPSKDPPVSYPTVREASQGLLGEAIEIAAACDLEFAVVGGWSPFLLNGKGEMVHPGTHDVDLLFKDGAKQGELAEVVKLFTSSGYWRSAKHEFQLLRILQVQGEQFVFNVDLLHAVEAANSPDMFVDHISLPIRLSEFTPEIVTTRSIKLVTSDFVFDGHVATPKVRCALPSGEIRDVSVPVIDEVATMVTKARSMESPKRPRDAFDILMAARQARQPERLVEGLRGLEGRHQSALAEATRLWGLVTEAEHQPRVAGFWPAASDDEVWAKVVEEMANLLTEARVPQPKAKECRGATR